MIEKYRSYNGDGVWIMKKKALLIATVGGFVTHFEWSNVRLLQEMGYEIYAASNYHDYLPAIR